MQLAPSKELQSNKVVVLDYHVPELLENKIFIKDLAFAGSHTNLPMVYLFEQLQKHGWQMVTPDVYVSWKEKPKHAVLMSQQTSEFTPQLLSGGVKPLILFCLESPYIATTFYVKLKTISSLFRHSFVFSGMRSRLSGDTIYHQMYYPQSYTEKDFVLDGFNARKLSCMVSGNKRVSNFKKDVILKFLYGFGVKNIYQERQRIISAAHGYDFDLYGTGWEKEQDEVVKSVYRGVVKDKFKTISKYRFTFCFENSVFPGYVTEKIIDSIAAGSVPVYCGAPDILDFVPEESFISVSHFKDARDLFEFITTMKESEWGGYRDAMQAFLKSERYNRFTQTYFTDQILGILNAEHV